MSRANSGRYVQTATGKKGMAYNKDKPVNGKIVVYVFEDSLQANLFGDIPNLRDFPDAKKILCDPKNLKVIGFFD